MLAASMIGTAHQMVLVVVDDLLTHDQVVIN
jgi:hypothetical protein